MSTNKLREALEMIVWSNDSAWQSQCAREALAADDAARWTLPVLPEPQARPGPDRLCGYSAEQMRAYGEACAAASRSAAPQSVEPVAEVRCWEEPQYERPARQMYEMTQLPGFRALQSGIYKLYLAPPTASTDAEWLEEAMRLYHDMDERSLRAHLSTRPAQAEEWEHGFEVCEVRGDDWLQVASGSAADEATALKEAADELERLTRELEEARKDQARYREWRRAFREGECGLWNALCDCQSQEEHDAAIDAAMSQEKRKAALDRMARDADELGLDF